MTTDTKNNIAFMPRSERIHPDAILQMARGAGLKNVIVIGWTEDGGFYYSGSEPIEQTIYMMRNAEFELFCSMGEDEAS